jgi:cytochrome d ubiquinol oxidase subunit II
VGGIASGRVPVGNADGDLVTSWLNPVSLLVGALFVATGAYLSAVFLISEARRFGDFELERYFTVRALAAAIAAGAIALAGVFVLHDDARYLYDRLTDQALPLMIFSAACGLGVVVLLVRGAPRGTRALAVGAVVGVVWGWGVAQFPYLLPEKLTISQGAAPSATLTAVLVVFGAALLLVIPALAFLYTLAQRSMLLEGESESPGG